MPEPPTRCPATAVTPACLLIPGPITQPPWRCQRPEQPQGQPNAPLPGPQRIARMVHAKQGQPKPRPDHHARPNLPRGDRQPSLARGLRLCRPYGRQQDGPQRTRVRKPCDTAPHIWTGASTTLQQRIEKERESVFGRRKQPIGLSRRSPPSRTRESTGSDTHRNSLRPLPVYRDPGSSHHRGHRQPRQPSSFRRRLFP